MNLIVMFAVLLGGFLLIGTLAAIFGDRRPEQRGEEPEELPRVVVSQQVPSVFDSFKRGK